MPHVMWQEQGYAVKNDDNKLEILTGEQSSSSEFDNDIRNLVSFLSYIGEPSKIKRLAVGKWVLIYLALFFFLAYALKKAYWEDVH